MTPSATGCALRWSHEEGQWELWSVYPDEVWERWTGHPALSGKDEEAARQWAQAELERAGRQVADWARDKEGPLVASLV